MELLLPNVRIYGRGKEKLVMLMLAFIMAVVA